MNKKGNRRCEHLVQAPSLEEHKGGGKGREEKMKREAQCLKVFDSFCFIKVIHRYTPC
jgi:hypothetical protein